MTQVRDDHGLLDRLAMAGLATHVFVAAPAVAETGSLDDEADYLDALGLLAEGPIWRIGAYRYAFRAAPGAGAEAVTAAMHMALPDHPGLDGAEITPLAPSVPPRSSTPQSSTPHPGLVLLTAACRTALALPGAQRLVVDAALAEAAAAQVAEHIAQASAAVAARIAEASTPVEAPTAEPDPALGRIEATLVALRDSAGAVPESVRILLDRMAERLDTVQADHAAANASTLAALADDIATRMDKQAAAQAAAAERLAAVEAAIEAVAGALDRPTTSPKVTAMAEKLAALEAEAVRRAEMAALVERIETLAAEVAATGAAVAADPNASRMAEIAAGLADIAARPVVTIDLDREREQMAGLAAALDGMIGRVETTAARLESAPEPGGIEAVAERLDALTAAIAPADATLAERLRGAIEDGLARLDSVLARRDAEARALAAAARRMGEACAELYGLHGRYLDALPPVGADAPAVVEPAQPAAVLPEPVAETDDTAPADDLGAFEADRAFDKAPRQGARA